MKQFDMDHEQGQYAQPPTNFGWRLHSMLLFVAFFLAITTTQAQPSCGTDGPGAFDTEACLFENYGPLVNCQGLSVNCSGGTFKHGTGAEWYLNGSLEVAAGSTVQIDAGAVAYIYGNIYNVGIIQVNGTLYFYGDHWINAATASVTGTGTVHFIGVRPAPGGTGANSETRPNCTIADPTNTFPGSNNTQCLDGGSITMTPNFSLNNTGDIALSEQTYTGINVTIAADGSTNAVFSGSITFSADDTHIWLGSNNLILTNTGSFVNCSAQRYAVTNGTGTLQKLGLDASGSFSNFIFPVGIDGTVDGFAPARVIDNAAGADDYAVRVQNTAPTAIGTINVTAPAEGPNRYWNVTSATSPSQDFQLSLQHRLSQEGTDYAANTTNRYITRNIGAPSGSGATLSYTNWDRTGSSSAETNSTLECASTTDGNIGVLTRTLSGTGLSGWYSKTYDHISPFDNAPTVNVKVFLQGPYNSGTGLMNTTLNSSGILQANAATQPYNTAPFNYTGTESVGSGFFAANPTIVDWVLVELRDATTPSTVIATRAAFVKSDGKVVDVDGTSAVSFTGVASGTYHVAIRHRNHLGIRTASALSFSSSSTTNYDFTTASAQANGTHPMVNVGSGVWALWAGDVNNDTYVRNAASPSDVSALVTAVATHSGNTFGAGTYKGFSNVYSAFDVNMDGKVYNSVTPSDKSIIVANVAGHPANTLYDPSYSIAEQIP